MQEQTSNMMSDEVADDQAIFLLNLVFTPDQVHFTSKNVVKEYISKVCANGLEPKYIDFKNGAPSKSILRFASKLEADFCVKQILDAKWKASKDRNATQKKGSAKKKQQSLLSMMKGKKEEDVEMKDATENIDECTFI